MKQTPEDAWNSLSVEERVKIHSLYRKARRQHVSVNPSLIEETVLRARRTPAKRSQVEENVLEW